MPTVLNGYSPKKIGLAKKNEKTRSPIGRAERNLLKLMAISLIRFEIAPEFPGWD